MEHLRQIAPELQALKETHGGTRPAGWMLTKCRC